MKQLINFKPPRLAALNYEFTDSKFVTAFDSENIYYKNIKLNKNTKLSNLSKLEIFKQENYTNSIPYGNMFPSTFPCNYTVRSNWDAENSSRSLRQTKQYVTAAGLNRAYINVLDESLRNSNTGTISTFKDSANVDHMVHIVFLENPISSNYNFDIKIILMEASSLDNITDSITKVYSNTTSPLNSSIKTGTASILWIDNVNEFIYLYVDVGLVSSSLSGLHTSSLYRVAYTTKSTSGMLSLGDYEYLNVLTPTYYSMYHLHSAPFYYCGKSNNGNPVYIRACEKDANTSDGVWYSSAETHLHRYIIVEHVLSTNTMTVLYDVNSTTSWGLGSNISSSVNRVTGMFSPTSFIQTDPSSDVYVSYFPAFDTTNNLRIIGIFWDKSTNVFQIKLLNLSNQADIKTLYQDPFDDAVLPYATSNSNTSISLSLKHIAPVKLEIIKGNDGNYYLSIFNEFLSNRYLAFSTSPVTKNIITYAISNNWETLTHVQTTPLNAIMTFFPDANRNNLFVAENNSLSIWQFNPTTYWQKLSNTPNVYPYFFSKKDDNSVYVVDMGSDEFQLIATTEQPERKFIDVNVHEVSVLSAGSNTINLIVNENLTYEGSPITSTIQVEVRDTSSQRVSTDIVIEIHSSNCTFDDFSNIKTITTSDADFVSIPILLNSPGLVYITSKFDI